MHKEDAEHPLQPTRFRWRFARCAAEARSWAAFLN
jgi:hypothetical protein